MTTDYQDYSQIKAKFFSKHKHDYKVTTSFMDNAGSYHKEYMFADGSEWYEVMTPVFEKVTVEVKMVKVEVEVKLLRTEFWSSEFGSCYYYEKF